MFFKRHFRFTEESNGNQRIPIAPHLPHTHTVSLISLSRKLGTFVTVDEPILTHGYYELKLLVDIRVRAWCCAFCGFRETVNDIVSEGGFARFSVKVGAGPGFTQEHGFEREI